MQKCKWFTYYLVVNKKKMQITTNYEYNMNT